MLCSHLVDIIICFLQNNSDDDSSINNRGAIIVFECLVCYVVFSPWDHHSESSLQPVQVEVCACVGFGGKIDSICCSTQVITECPTTMQGDMYEVSGNSTHRASQTSILCTPVEFMQVCTRSHSAQRLECRCTNPEYNHDS